MSNIIDFPVPTGQLVWITGTACEHCECEDCRSRNGQLFMRSAIQLLNFKFKPPLHEGCDCTLVENIIGEEKGDYRVYRPGIRPLRNEE